MNLRPDRWPVLPLAIFYGLAGTAHLLWPEPFVRIVPRMIPRPDLVVWLTGMCELAGAAGLLFKGWRALAGLMLALYAIAVFPANIQHALDGLAGTAWPRTMWYHAPRLLAQPVLVLWAWAIWRRG